MLSDMILHKYMRHLRYIDQGSIVHLDAVELALRLALDELAESIPSTDVHTTEQLGAANLRIMELQADLERLQTDADTEIAALKAQLTELDTDNAAMIRRNRELVAALDIAKPAAIHNTDHPNGTAVTMAPPAAIHPNTLNDFAPANLTPENHDWWLGLTAGRHTWRNLPKRNRLDLVRYVLSFGPPDAALKMIEFDAIKPDWMPGSGSHTKTLNLSWSQLNDWSVEL